ncbi:hypothetical protein FPV67DRAFT_1495055 [Lyophyllum atratum]|nr:hypothetical protein FPV67DRAFT_1495055 [Lyophyllum atratum]
MTYSPRLPSILFQCLSCLYPFCLGEQLYFAVNKTKSRLFEHCKRTPNDHAPNERPSRSIHHPRLHSSWSKFYIIATHLTNDPIFMPAGL